MEFLYAVFLLYFVQRFFREMVTSRNSSDPPNILNFWSDGWNIIDFVILSLAFVFVILLMLYQADPAKSTFNIKTEKYVDLFPIAEYAEMITQINAIAVLICFAKIFKYLNLSASFDMLSAVVLRALPDCMFFLILLGVVFFGYSYMSNIYFGNFIEAYAKIEHAMVTLFLVTMGEFEYEEFGEVSQIFAAVFFFTFIILVFFILLNIFIGIINEAYAQEQAKPLMSMVEEFSIWSSTLQEDMARPFVEMMDQAKEYAKQLEQMAMEAKYLYEQAKRREAIGSNLVLKLRDHERFEWADLAKSLWNTPLPKPEDLMATGQELLKFYTEAYDDALPLFNGVKEAGARPDGTNMFELEVQALQRLVKELEEKMDETEARIEDEKEALRAEKRAAGGKGSSELLDDGEGLDDTEKGSMSVEMKEI